MALTTEEIVAIARDLTLGKPNPVDTEEGRAMAEELRKEIAEAREAGLEMDFPYEWPDPNGDAATAL